MPYFVGTCVLLAIVYVLSRTGAPAGCSTVPGAVPDGFDIDAYREERLAATPPNIIECAEASEGESQVRPRVVYHSWRGRGRGWGWARGRMRE